MKVQVEAIKGYDCFTNFHGMDVTREKLCQLVKKWHTLVEAFAQAKTADGYMMRLFCIGFTKRTNRQVKATCYTKNSQKRAIRKKMMEIMINETQKSTLKDLTKKFITESIGKQIRNECSKIFPLSTVMIKKVKVLKKPKFDLTKLMDLYQEKPEARQEKAAPTAGGEEKEEEPKNKLA
mmetsp:Transcript_6542/g.4913  ORF Transcript_6542/g.4913 Transcript_6542/m.4913 type:complete len:179 (+) Transcript_6542:371-907(+)